jgi:transposase
MNIHIKTPKHLSYGFKSFQNIKTRIFLMNDLIKMTEQKSWSLKALHSQ